MTPIFAALCSLLGGAVGAFIASTLRLGEHSSQQVWNRRAEAYTAIFGAVATHLRWFEAALLEWEHRGDWSEADDKGARAGVSEAIDALDDRLAREAWLISDQFRERLEQMERERDIDVAQMWIDYLQHGQQVLSSAMKELRVIARADLRVR